MSQQTEAFLREYHYHQAQELYRLLDEHPWSRRLSQRDAGAVAEAQRQAQVLAGDLYHLREELTARLAAADEVAGKLEALIAEIDRAETEEDCEILATGYVIEQARAALAARGEEK